MTKSIVLDTNALPVQRGLGGPLWLSARKLCAMHDIEILVPSIVVRESVNLRRSRYAEVEKEFLKALAKINKFYDLQSVYVPSVEEICDSWENELMDSLSILNVDGSDAVEALNREATRLRPARDGVGARDSAIWLSAVRRAQKDEVVYFISNNTKDFGDKGDASLHPSLLDEVAAVSGEVRYLRSVNDLIDQLAERVAVPRLNIDATSTILQLDIDDQLAVLPEVIIKFDVESSAALNAQNTHVTEVRGVSAYAIGEKLLVLISGKGSSEIIAANKSIDATFAFGAWIELDLGSDEVLSGEVHQVSLG